MPVGGEDDLAQPEDVPSEEKDPDADPTYLAPQGHGRFAFRWPRLATAADNFAKGNAQAESKIISNWLTTGLEIAMNRMGWFLLSPKQELTLLDEPQLKLYYHNGHPDCQQDERPYQTGCQYKSSDADWATMSLWLTAHRRELRRKAKGTKAERTTRNKSRRTAPPGGTGSSSSTARPNDRNLPPATPEANVRGEAIVGQSQGGASCRT